MLIRCLSSQHIDLILQTLINPFSPSSSSPLSPCIVLVLTRRLVAPLPRLSHPPPTLYPPAPRHQTSTKQKVLNVNNRPQHATTQRHTPQHATLPERGGVRAENLLPCFGLARIKLRFRRKPQRTDLEWNAAGKDTGNQTRRAARRRLTRERLQPMTSLLM